MNLFTKEKELILKLVNGILLLWLVIVTIISFNLALEVAMPEAKETYEEFSFNFCPKEDYEEKDCKENYLYNLKYYEDNIRNNKKSLAVAVFAAAAMGTTLLVLNPKAKENKKKKTN